MKKVVALVFVCALLLLMLAPVISGVNTTSTIGTASWADGGTPPPPLPSFVTTWNDGGTPPPPLPS